MNKKTTIIQLFSSTSLLRRNPKKQSDVTKTHKETYFCFCLCVFFHSFNSHNVCFHFAAHAHHPVEGLCNLKSPAHTSLLSGFQVEFSHSRKKQFTSTAKFYNEYEIYLQLFVYWQIKTPQQI